MNANNKSTSVGFCWSTVETDLIFCTPTSATPATVTGTSSTAATHPVTGLTPGTTYFFVVVTTNGDVTVVGSTLSFTTSLGTAQTISFTQPADMFVGEADKGLTYSSSSSLPVTVVSDTLSVCTVTASKVRAVAAGTCSLTATQAGDATFQPAAPLTRTFTVSDSPVATTGPATAITRTSATLNGSVDSRNAGTTVTFCYDTQSNLGTKCTSAPATPGTVTGLGSTVVSTALTGLSGGTTYWFRVTGVNSNGTTSGSTLSFTTTPKLTQTITFPSPTPMAITTDQTLGATSDSGLTVTYTPTDSKICTVSGTTVHAVAVGTCTLTADQSGDGSYLVAAPVSESFTVYAAPATPAAVTGVAGDGQVTVTWTAPVDNGSAIVEFEVVSTPDSATCTGTGTDTSCVVTGLTNGTKYSFQVRARNAAGWSALSAKSGTYTPFGPPKKPGTPVASAGDTAATVSWAYDGTHKNGSAITSFVVTSHPGSITCVQTTFKNSGTEDCAFALGQLTNGTAYTFTVHATTADPGVSSPESDASNAVTPSGLPDQPAQPTVQVGDTQIVVDWTAADGNGTPITAYTVRASADATDCTVDMTLVPAPALTCTMTGLKNGKSYTFSVRSTNKNGNSAWSPASVGVRPSKPPQPPTGVTAAAGDTRATVTWVAPLDDGGNPLLSFTATSSPDGRTCTAVAPALSCTVPGLTNGTAYTFTVTAANITGDGAASTASNTVTPFGVPLTPAAPTAIAGDQSATVSWTAPGANGRPITGYVVTATPGGRLCSVDVTLVPTPGLTCVVTGLVNGTSYTFTVVATNLAGDSAASPASSPVVPSVVPDAPTAVTATSGDRTATVTWTAPASDGGRPITRYTVTSSPGARTCTVTTTPLATSCTFTSGDLTNGTAYTFTVVATNVTGDGAASSASATVTPSGLPGTPLIVSAKPGDTTVSLTWTAPDDNGSPITRYHVTASPGSHSWWVPAAAPGATVPLSARTKSAAAAAAATSPVSQLLTGLTNGTDYVVVVTALNANGSSLAGDSASTVVTPFGAPSAPTHITVVVGDGSATVTWTAPTDDGGRPITKYVVTASPGGRTCTATAPASSCTVTGLTNGVTYRFTVTAYNSGGEYTASAVSASPSVVPSAAHGSTSAPTGAGDVVRQVALALLFLGFGAVLLIGARRRRVA